MDRILVLVRHGQSEWNLKNLFTGWKDPDLTDQGVEEAKAAGRKLKAAGLGFDIAFTSDLLRAQRTMQLLLAELGAPDLPTVRNVALNERDYGDLSGLNKADAAKKWGRSRSISGAAPMTCRRPAAKASRIRLRARCPIIASRSCPRAERPARHRRRTWQFAARAGDGAR